MLKQTNVIDTINKETAANMFGASTATEEWPKDISRGQPKNISRESLDQESVLVGMKKNKPVKRFFPSENPDNIVIFKHNSGGPYPLSMAVKGDFSMLAGGDEVVLRKHQMTLWFHLPGHEEKDKKLSVKAQEDHKFTKERILKIVAKAIEELLRDLKLMHRIQDLYIGLLCPVRKGGWQVELYCKESK